MTNQRGEMVASCPPRGLMHANRRRKADAFIPVRSGDGLRKFENAKKTAADALIRPRGSIAPEGEESLRGVWCARCSMPRIGPEGICPRQCARHGHDAWRDLAAVMPGPPDGIVLPKCAGAADVNRTLSLYLMPSEAAAGIEHGSHEE
jgi:citrate lyase subunit beta/citryl-CoA lyase